ncbi:hypothetical protein H7H51_30975 [Mycolicibacterium farcinogenes]|nr:hypothetical protein [Mycolicibacterium farcinogenes]
MQRGGDQGTTTGQPGAVIELHGGQFAVRGDESGDGSFVDGDPCCIEFLDLRLVQSTVPVGEHHQILGPAAHHQRRVHRPVTLCDHRNRRITHLPPVAERTVENRTAPKLFESGNLRCAVLHAGGQQHRPGTLAGAVGQVEHETGLTAHDVTGAHLHSRVGRQFVATRGVEVGGRPAVAAQQAADPGRGQIARLSRIDQQHSAPGATQHQRCTQPGGSPTDDDAIPWLVQSFEVHDVELAESASKMPS